MILINGTKIISLEAMSAVLRVKKKKQREGRRRQAKRREVNGGERDHRLAF